MRWYETKAGTMRTRTKFLLFPKKIKGQTRWLERASWCEYYDTMLGWIADKWVD